MHKSAKKMDNRFSFNIFSPKLQKSTKWNPDVCHTCPLSPIVKNDFLLHCSPTAEFRVLTFKSESIRVHKRKHFTSFTADRKEVECFLQVWKKKKKYMKTHTTKKNHHNVFMGFIFLLLWWVWMIIKMKMKGLA